MIGNWNSVKLIKFLRDGTAAVDVKDIDPVIGLPYGLKIITQEEWFQNCNRWKGEKVLIYEMNGGG